MGRLGAGCKVGMESLPQDSLTTSHEMGEGKRSAHVGWLRLRLKDSYDLAWNPLTSSLRAPLTSSFPPLVNPTPQPPHGINQELESRGWKRAPAPPLMSPRNHL